MNDVVADREHGGGTAKTYSTSSDVAFDVARDVLRSRGADAIEEHRSEGHMLTSGSVNGLTRGTLVGVWVTPAGDHTTVTVVTKRRRPTDAITMLTEDGFHVYFTQTLAGKQRIARDLGQ